jgi:hypothetical protein
MKLLFTSLLFSLAAAEQQNRGLQQQYSDAGDLYSRWDMSEPAIDYDQTTDIFTFTFMTASTDNFNEGLEESFWNPDCMPAEFGITGVPVAPPLIQSVADENTLPELVMTSVGGVDRPQMTFKIDAAEFSTSGPSGTYSTTVGTATIDFCIRSSLGYTEVPGAALPSNYQEVNFIETLVQIEYDMASGFAVEAFAVAPKARQLTTISESYEDALKAYLCIGPQHPDYVAATHDIEITLDNGVVYTRPKELTDYNASNGPTGKKFDQGSLINVCVQVKDEFATQDIVLKELISFSWIRTGGTTFDSSIGGGTGLNTINQDAIFNSAPAGNWLTSYDAGRCLNEYWCDFASVLFAQFYNTEGTVTGAGDASLQFLTRRRRLGEGEQRRLQDDPGAAGMDISIDVNGEVEGPGDLKTAGGSSKTIAFASAVAFVGAALLA